MIDLLLIRHGATAGNLEKRYIGRTDEPLSALGVQQALKLHEQHFQADFLFVSPLLRARQTAEMVFPLLPYTVVDELAETDFGHFEGRTAAELADSKEYQSWVASRCLAPIPGGECVEDFKKRCCDTFREVMSGVPDGASVSLVTHGGVIMAIMETFGQPKRSFYEYHIGNGEAIRCHYADGIISMTRREL